MALLGLASTILVQWMNRRKTLAEAKSLDADYGVKLTDSAMKIIDQLQDEVSALRQRLKEVDIEREAERKELIELRTEVKALRIEVKALRVENEALHTKLDKLECRDA